MVVDLDWFSPTRVAGLLAYGATSMACAARWVNARRNGTSSQLYAVLAAVQFFLFLDMAFNWRWKIHEFWGQDAMQHGVYSERRPPQVIAIVGLIVLVIFASVFISARFRNRKGAGLALTATITSVGLWCCEAISYHYIDLVFYHMVGKMMVVSFVWLFMAMITCFGVWLDGRSRPKSTRQMTR
jgi:hypothetical protein